MKTLLTGIILSIIILCFGGFLFAYGNNPAEPHFIIRGIGLLLIAYSLLMLYHTWKLVYKKNK